MVYRHNGAAGNLLSATRHRSPSQRCAAVSIRRFTGYDLRHHARGLSNAFVVSARTGPDALDAEQMEGAALVGEMATEIRTGRSLEFTAECGGRVYGAKGAE